LQQAKFPIFFFWRHSDISLLEHGKKEKWRKAKMKIGDKRRKMKEKKNRALEIANLAPAASC